MATMKIFSEYERSSGLLTGRILGGDWVEQNIADGCAVVEGQFDPNLYRVDPQTQEVIVPSDEVVQRYKNKPTPTAQWDRETMQWQYDELALAKQLKRAWVENECVKDARSDIASHITSTQDLRVLSVVVQELPTNIKSSGKLSELLSLLSNLDQALSAIDAATTKEQVEAVTFRGRK